MGMPPRVNADWLRLALHLRFVDTESADKVFRSIVALYGPMPVNEYADGGWHWHDSSAPLMIGTAPWWRPPGAGRHGGEGFVVLSILAPPGGQTLSGGLLDWLNELSQGDLPPGCIEAWLIDRDGNPEPDQCVAWVRHCSQPARPVVLTLREAHDPEDPPIDARRLSHWLPLLREAGIPHVPAHPIAEAPVQELCGVLDEDAPVPPAAMSFFRSAHRVIADLRTSLIPAVLRWDPCSPEDLKHAMAKGAGDWSLPPATSLRLTIDDTRFVDIHEELGHTDPARLFWRPWVVPLTCGKHPVEFRVFVEDRRVRAVSAYYPQQPLEGEVYAALAGEARAMTNELLRRVPAAFLPSGFVADWIVRADDRALLWLEGGPAYSLGQTHPCCFNPDAVTGMALSRQPGSLDR